VKVYLSKLLRCFASVGSHSRICVKVYSVSLLTVLPGTPLGPIGPADPENPCGPITPGGPSAPYN